MCSTQMGSAGTNQRKTPTCSSFVIYSAASNREVKMEKSTYTDKPMIKLSHTGNYSSHTCSIKRAMFILFHLRPCERWLFSVRVELLFYFWVDTNNFELHKSPFPFLICLATKLAFFYVQSVLNRGAGYTWTWMFTMKGIFYCNYCIMLNSI